MTHQQLQRTCLEALRIFVFDLIVALSRTDYQAAFSPLVFFIFLGSSSGELLLAKLGLVSLTGSTLTKVTGSFGQDVPAGWIILVSSGLYLLRGKAELQLTAQRRTERSITLNGIYLYFEIHTHCPTSSFFHVYGTENLYNFSRNVCSVITRTLVRLFGFFSENFLFSYCVIMANGIFSVWNA